jgi:four helix bundle protein
MRDFHQLSVWQKSHQFTLDVYALTRAFPKEELFGLTFQIRRSSSSIATNIAEGCGRGTDADFGRFLQMAMGSASESEYQILLSYDLTYIDENQYKQMNAKVTEIKRMLSSLISKTK